MIGKFEYARRVSLELVKQQSGQSKQPDGSWSPEPLRIHDLTEEALELMYRRQPNAPYEAVRVWNDWGSVLGEFKEELSVGFEGKR